MTVAQARDLNSKGLLTRKVMTEEGWYLPAPPAAGSLPPPLMLPPIKPRKTRKAKGA